MLFAAQIYVATTAEHIQSQRRKNNEPNYQFPHVLLLKNDRHKLTRAPNLLPEAPVLKRLLRCIRSQEFI